MAAGEPGSASGRSAAAAYCDRIAGGPPRETFSPRRGGALDEVRIYALDHPAAWQLVTRGLADLGFELTLRLARPDEELPTWAVDFLVSLANYARSSGHGFAAGHHIDLRGPMRLGSTSAITAAAVTVDPALGRWGQVDYLLVVGLTADELELCRSWRTAAVVGLLADRDGLFTTVLDRSSLLDDPALREVAEAGVAAEGSSLDHLRVASLGWRSQRRGKRLVVTLGAGAATALGPALRRKLTQPGASFAVIGDQGELRFEMGSGPTNRWSLGEDAVVVEVGAGSVEALAALFSGKVGTGSLASLTGLRFVVMH